MSFSLTERETFSIPLLKNSNSVGCQECQPVFITSKVEPDENQFNSCYTTTLLDKFGLNTAQVRPSSIGSGYMPVGQRQARFKCPTTTAKAPTVEPPFIEVIENSADKVHCQSKTNTPIRSQSIPNIAWEEGSSVALRSIGSFVCRIFRRPIWLLVVAPIYCCLLVPDSLYNSERCDRSPEASSYACYTDIRAFPCGAS